MMMRIWSKILLCTLILVTLSGCGYHLTNSPTNRKENFQNIWVPFFSNESISPTAQTVLRRAFYDELHALRGLNPAKSPESADLSMKAKLISYSSGAASYSAQDQVREYKLYLSVELEAYKKGQLLPVWKGQIQSSRQYPAHNDIALQRNAEDQALDAAARILAHKFITAIEESY
ncbi:MAG: LPS assembly lipoprotein LptE [Desulfuromonadaceae bacterium]